LEGKILMVLKLSETILVKNRINCRNLALQLTQNKKALKLVNRINLKQKLSLYPKYQLELLILETIYILYQKNEIVA
jgi:hypothetical protein